MSRSQPKPRLWPHVLAWWPLLFALWLLLCGSLEWPELWVGAACALGSAWLAAVLRRAGVIPFDPGPAWLTKLPRLWLHLVVESWQLFVHLLRTLRARRPEGTFVSLERRWTPGDPAAGRERAWITLAMSVTPNTVVVGIDVASGRILLHQLLPQEDARASLEALL